MNHSVIVPANVTAARDEPSNDAQPPTTDASSTSPPTGVAPWERTGVAVAAPGGTTAQVAAQRWQDAASQMETEEAARRAQRAEARRIKEEERKQEAAKKLEDTARRMYYLGFALLPLVWLVNLAYFRKELKSDSSNPAIKKYVRRSGILSAVATAVFVAWVLAYQLNRSNLLRLSVLRGENVLSSLD